ncbi:L-rhamnose/proton symporter RhaT [Pedobacter jamesrossensis]|uniref:L-rhamnose/proton symporter RhaT n=1 Tax=Pedobacter jamesrossensis TaxID=1908238 RepID=A0ABV8NN93_9SPHI
MNFILGLVLHAIGGFASGSFLIPFKRVKDWAWESSWLISGVAAWIIMPWLTGYLTIPDLFNLFRDVDSSTLLWCLLFGSLWGLGSMTFGLSMRYLGFSLGFSITLGLCAVLGTLVPPIFYGTFSQLLNNVSGLTTLAGVFICLLGIGVCGWAGILKERSLSIEKKKETIKEFNFGKGIVTALFSGILSSCFAFGLTAGKPLADLAISRGVAPLWQNNAVLIMVLMGGFVTNIVWCIVLNARNRTAGDYTKKTDFQKSNYFFSALAGIIWYLQFMFYGMGSTRMGDYDFASWSIHMAFVITFSNLWGLYFKEWKGSNSSTMKTIFTGIAIVIISTLVIGYGSYLNSTGQ